jgi:hypothetical protein
MSSQARGVSPVTAQPSSSADYPFLSRLAFATGAWFDAGLDGGKTFFGGILPEHMFALIVEPPPILQSDDDGVPDGPLIVDDFNSRMGFEFLERRIRFG